MVPEEIDADSEAELESISRWQKTCSQKVARDRNNNRTKIFLMAQFLFLQLFFADCLFFSLSFSVCLD